MRKIFLTILCLSLILILNCDLRDILFPDRHNVISTSWIILFEDIDQISLDPDPTYIRSAEVEMNKLKLKVDYAGGCEKHEFKLYGWKGISKSNPPQAEIFLSHDANGDACEALIIKDLTFDLTPLKLHYQMNYKQNGPLLLRIYVPGATEPFEPLPIYNF